MYFSGINILIALSKFARLIFKIRYFQFANHILHRGCWPFVLLCCVLLFCVLILLCTKRNVKNRLAHLASFLRGEIFGILRSIRAFCEIEKSTQISALGKCAKAPISSEKDAKKVCLRTPQF